MEKNIWYIVAGLVAVWFLFLRKRTAITGGANLSVATGNNATPYTGYPPGYVPQGNYFGNGYAGAAPNAPQPDSTGATLAGVGSLLGGLGNLAGGVLGGLGSAGVFSGGGGGGADASAGSYDDYGGSY